MDSTLASMKLLVTPALPPALPVSGSTAPPVSAGKVAVVPSGAAVDDLNEITVDNQLRHDCIPFPNHRNWGGGCAFFVFTGPVDLDANVQASPKGEQWTQYSP